MKSEKISLDLENEQANLLKLLAHPVRIAILKILQQEEACVCHMEATLGFRQAYLSQQLAVLRQAEIISDRRDGWNVYYQIQNEGILEILQLSEKLAGPGKSEIPFQPASCPCPKCSAKTGKESTCNQAKKEYNNVNN
jgi:ArsR family transcriptional regulator